MEDETHCYPLSRRILIDEDLVDAERVLSATGSSRVIK